MKFLHIRKYFLISFCALLITTGLAFAVETFQNNLLKIDVYQSSLGGVKITLYTSKPYTDPINVIKKTDLDYVIFMPETSSSISAKPTLKSAQEVIKNIDIKTQPYANQMKGYTKIIISTTKATNITPQVQTLNAAVLNKNEVTAPKKTVIVKQKTPPMPPAVKVGENRPQAKKGLPVKKELSRQKTGQYSYQSANQSSKSEKIKRNYSHQTPAQAPIIKQINQPKTINKPVGKAKTTPTKAKATVASSLPKPVPMPIKTAPAVGPRVAPKSISTATPNAAAPKATVTKLTPTAAKTPLPPATSADNTAQPQPLQPQPSQTPIGQGQQTPTPQTNNLPPSSQAEGQTAVGPQPQQTKVITSVQSPPMTDSSLYMKIGIGTIAILLLLLLSRAISKSNKKRRQQNADFINNSPVPPLEPEISSSAESFSDNIQGSKNWREKYKNYVASETPPENKQEDQPFEPEVEIEKPQQTIFDDTTVQENSEINTEEEIAPFEEPPAEQSLREEPPIEQPSFDESIFEEMKEQQPPFEEPEIEQALGAQPQVQQPEFEQPQVEEEYTQIFEEEMPKYQVAEEEQQTQEEEMEEEPSLLDELDEILAQGNIGEENEVSVEELFKDEFARILSPLDSLEVRRELDEEPTKSIEEMTEEYQKDLTPLEEIPVVDYEESPILEVEEPQEEIELLSLEPVETEEAEEEESITIEEPNDQEIIKSEFAIDKDKGFYLVDVENSSALVGHIKDKIFVIKQFDQKVHAPLQARLDEQKDGSSNYMAKVGSFRGLVEVTKKEMNLLIEL